MARGNHYRLWAGSIFGVALILLLRAYLYPTSINKTPSHGNEDAWTLEATYQQFDSRGYLKARLYAIKMYHFKKNNAVFFIKPRLLLYTKAHLPWYIRSDHGKSKQGDHWVYLWGHVIIFQPTSKKTVSTRITTSTLTIYPNQKIAKTDQPVTIVRPGSITHATGLNAHFKTGWFRLLSHIRGQYAFKSQ